MHNKCDVLILTARFGHGHVSVSEAIKEHLLDENHKLNVVTIDFFEAISPMFYKSIYKSYELLIKNGVALYNYHYNLKNKKTGKLSLNFSRLDKMIEALNPKVVISTFPSCAKYMANYKENKSKNIITVTCITDVIDKCEWIHDCTDMYFVPTVSVRRQLIRRGITSDKLMVIGIPVKKAFWAQNSKEALRLEKGFMPDDKIVLMMGGGLGLMPKAKRFYENLLDQQADIHLIVVTGNNKKLYNKLTRIDHHRLHIMPFIDSVSTYMRMADVFVGKVGGITLFEAIASELPIITPKPILAQEKGNTQFVNISGIGHMAKDNKAMSDAIIRLLYHDTHRKKIDMSLKKVKGRIDMASMKRWLIRHTTDRPCDDRLLKALG